MSRLSNCFCAKIASGGKLCLFAAFFFLFHFHLLKTTEVASPKNMPGQLPRDEGAEVLRDGLCEILWICAEQESPQATLLWGHWPAQTSPRLTAFGAAFSICLATEASWTRSCNITWRQAQWAHCSPQTLHALVSPGPWLCRTLWSWQHQGLGQGLQACSGQNREGLLQQPEPYAPINIPLKVPSGNWHPDTIHSLRFLDPPLWARLVLSCFCAALGGGGNNDIKNLYSTYHVLGIPMLCVHLTWIY